MKLLALFLFAACLLPAQIINPSSDGSSGLTKASFAPPCNAANAGKGYYIPGTPTVEFCLDITGSGSYQYFVLSGNQQFAANMQTWATALANASTTNTHMAIIGDSLSACYGVGNPMNCWPRRLSTSLQTHYGNNGSGILPLLQGTLPGGNTNGSAYWNIAGPVSFPTAGNYGPYQSSSTGVSGGPFSSILNLNSGTVQSISSWMATSVNIYVETDTTTAAATVFANGVSLGTCGGTTGTATNTICNFTVPAGMTQLKIVGPSSGNFYLYAGQFVNNATGISVDNLAHTGAEAGAFTYDIAHQLKELDDIQAGGKLSLVVIELSANEFLDGTTLTTLNTNLNTILAHVQAYSPKPSVVVWDFNYFMAQGDTPNGAGLTQTDYHNNLHTFATNNGLPIISMFDYWGKTGGTGFTYTDLAHPNDLGNNVEAQRAQLLIDPGGPAISSGDILAPTLLDGNPLVSSAYSVRRLYVGATKALQVTSSAAGNPTRDIGFTAAGDLDTTTLASFCGANTCTVSKWYDQSINGHDAVQATIANQPVIYTAGAVVTNGGKPTLQFGATASMVAPASITGSQTEGTSVGTIQTSAGAYAGLVNLMPADNNCNQSSGACEIVRNSTNNSAGIVTINSSYGGNYTPGTLFWADSILNGTSGTSAIDEGTPVTNGGFTANLAVTSMVLGGGNVELSEAVQYTANNASGSTVYLHASEKTYFNLP